MHWPSWFKPSGLKQSSRGVVFAHRAAENIHKLGRKENHSAIEWRAEGLSKLIEHGPLALDLQTLKATMTLDVGLVRRFSRLSRAKRRVDLLENEIDMILGKVNSNKGNCRIEEPSLLLRR